ncbi:MAG: type II secretion system minor pseudopilin GspK [Gammaproteobacteria bacterium]|nr:type II secretion system minor pseudopilin GspK [Gammaproteobacteria bacterium]
MLYKRFNSVNECQCAHSGLAGRTGERVRRVSGVALVSVLLVVALASAIASQMISRQALTVAHARHVFEGAQARQYAFGAEAYARQLLFEDWSKDNALDTLLENWSLPIQPFEIEEGRIELAIVDLERRLNLNAVRSPENLQRFKRLLAQLQLDTNLADAWLDWIDDDETVYGYGAEDEHYLLAQPAYRAANQPAASASAMLAVKGFTKDTYERLLPYVALLPVNELKVNVNTADGTVLYSLGASFAPEEGNAPIETAREFTDVAEAVTQYPGLREGMEALTVTSAFFEVQVRVEMGEAQAELVSTLYRDPVSGRIWLLGRDFGRRVPSTYDAVPAGTETVG